MVDRVVVTEKGALELSVHDCLEEAGEYIGVAGVESGEFEVYTAKGMLVRQSIKSENSKILGFIPFTYESVELVVTNIDASRELREYVESFYLKHKMNIKSHNLESMIEALVDV